MQPKSLPIDVLEGALALSGISVDTDSKGRRYAEGPDGKKVPISPDGSGWVPGMHIVHLAEEFGKDYRDIICDAVTYRNTQG